MVVDERGCTPPAWDVATGTFHHLIYHVNSSYIQRQVTEQVAAAMEEIRASAEAARVETELLAAADRTALAEASRAEFEALVQASSAAQDARYAEVQERTNEFAKEAADANAKLAEFAAARHLLGVTLGGTHPLTPAAVSWSVPVLSRAVAATFKDNEYDIRNISLTDYTAKLVSIVSSSPALVVVLQIAASARYGVLSSIGLYDPEANAALWSVMLMSTNGEARELVQQHGAINGTTGVSSAVHAMHALSKACEDTSVASLTRLLKSVFLGPTIGQSKNPTLAVISIEVEVRKLGDQFNVAVAPWLRDFLAGRCTG
jgi:hypothetical protein